MKFLVIFCLWKSLYFSRLKSSERKLKDIEESIDDENTTQI